MAYRPKDRIWTPAALSAPAVTLADMKDHLRVDHTAEDALIQSICVAATEAVERWTQRLLVQRAATLLLPSLPGAKLPVELPGGAVSTLTSVTADGVAITGCTVAGHSPAVLLPATDWPAVTGDGYPVSISYAVGFVTVPGDLLAAVKLIAADLYERRGQSTTAALQVVPISAEWLMAPHRIRPV